MKKKQIITSMIAYLVICCFVSMCHSSEIAAKIKKKTVVYKYSEICIGCKDTYKIKSLARVLKKSELNNKQIKWSCSNRRVKVKNKTCKANRVGSYKLVGKLKKKKKIYKYQIPLKVIAMDVPQVMGGAQSITVRSLNTKHIGETYKNVDITDANMISTILNYVNFVPAKYNFDKTYNPLSGDEGYVVLIKYADRRVVRISLNPTYVYWVEAYIDALGKNAYKVPVSCCYSSEKYDEFYQYIESLYESNQG